MTDSDAPSSPVPRSDEERSAFFDELMREEQRANLPPISGLSVATVIVSLLVWVGAYLSWFVALLWAGCALVCGVAALFQILHRDRRGLVFVGLGLADLAAWAVYVSVAPVMWG